MPPTQEPWRLSILWGREWKGGGGRCEEEAGRAKLEKEGLQRDGGGLQPLGLITH